jgi:DNA-binding response OmpR family regulator
LPSIATSPADASFRPIVLLVDQDWQERDEYDLTLSSAGLWVWQATDPGLGFDIAMGLLPDLVIATVDPTPPAPFLERLRNEPRTAKIPIIGITASEPDAESGLREHCSELLIKPVSSSFLLQRVRAVVQHSNMVVAKAEEARAKVPALLERSAKVIERSEQIRFGGAAIHRRCPVCRKLMEFTETRVVGGVTCDYYRPCRSNCGLFYYDRSRRTIVAMS